MKKETFTFSIFAISFILPLLIAISFNLSGDIRPAKKDAGHECRWQHCPYKGVLRADAKEAIIEYTGCDEGTDAYCIDFLHFYYPADDYDQLENKLFNIK